MLKRKALWVVLAIMVAVLLVRLAEILFIFYRPLFEDWTERHLGILFVVASASVAGLGLWRGWHRRPGLLRVRSFMAAGVLTFVAYSFVAIRHVIRQSKDKAALSLRQEGSAADQFFLENPGRIFATEKELVGPDKYIKGLNSVEGEDLHALFPIRRDLTDWSNWTLTLPDGRIVASPYRDPPKPDGVDVVQLPDHAGRFETTYRNGVPDGPFRAYYSDGKLWGEATYVKGRVTGPCWNYSLHSQKSDELTEGKVVQALRTLDEAARAPYELGLQKYRAHDFVGAIAGFTRAIEINPATSVFYPARADAYRAHGDLEAALADYTHGLEMSPNDHSIYYRRGQIRRLFHDLPGAAADFRMAVGLESHKQAVFWLFVTECEQGRREDASTELLAAVEGMKKSGGYAWEQQLAGFLLGRVTEEQLLALGQHSHDWTFIEAQFYGAMRCQLAGDHESALQRFRQVLAIPTPRDNSAAFEAFYYSERDEARRAVQASPEPPRAVQGQPEPPQPQKPLPDLTGPGMAKLREHDVAGAIAEFTSALKTQPGDVRLYYWRAEARRAQGDRAGAIADFTVVVDRPSDYPGVPVNICHLERGHLRRLQQDLAGAVEDFRVVAGGSLSNRDLLSWAGYWLYFTGCEQGRGKEAAGELDQIFARMDRAREDNQYAAQWYQWHRQAMELLLGRINEGRLLANMDVPDTGGKEGRRFEGLFIAAMHRQQAGDHPGAVDLFRQALAEPAAKMYEFESTEARRAVQAGNAPDQSASPPNTSSRF